MDVTDSSKTPKSFRYLDDLIRSGQSEIILDSDIDGNKENYQNAIKIDTDNLIIDGDNHAIDGKQNSVVFEITARKITIKNINFTSGCKIHISDNAVLRLVNIRGADIINDGTLILINCKDNHSVLNNNTLHIFESELTGNIKGSGEILPIRKKGSEENNFTYLKNLIDKEYNSFINSPHSEGDMAHVIFKGDVILDLEDDECFKFDEGFILDKDNIVIDGQGFTIDANHFSRPFTTSARNVSIKNLSLKNGRANDGGAIKVNMGLLKLSSISIEGCRALNSGGAIFNNGDVSIERLFILNNHSKNAIIDNRHGVITMDYVRFENNSSDGLIFNGDELVVMNSLFVKEMQTDTYSPRQNLITNNKVLKLFNNSFEEAFISNRKNAIIKIYDKKEEKDEVVYKSERFVIENYGRIRAYNFDDGAIPACRIVRNVEVEYVGDEMISKDEYFSSNHEWVEINILVSSTFKDMFAERSYLATGLFKDLKKWCKNRRILMRNIDLKCASNKSIAIIDEYLKDDNTFYLCFVGQKQGWFSASEDKLSSALLRPMSEILNDPSNERFKNHTMFFFRKDPFADVDLSPSQRSIYYGNGQDNADTIRKLVGDNFKSFDYTSKWNEDGIVSELTSSGDDRGRLEDFESNGEDLKDLILSEIKRQITEAFPDQKPYRSDDIYFEDAMIHNLDIEYKSRDFFGKKEKLRELDLRLNQHSNNVLLITGGEGIGKSTLLAKWHQTLKESEHKSIIRLCEGTLKSSTFQDLYLSIGSEARIFNGEDEKIRNGQYGFDSYFFNRLLEKGVDVLILSNVDKLGKFEPDYVPEDLFVVLSADSDYDLDIDHDRFELADSKVKNLKFESIEPYFGRLVDLDKNQKRNITQMFESKPQLFMRIVLNEMACSKSYEEIVEGISKFGNSPEDAFKHLIELFEEDKNLDSNLVKTVLVRLAFAGSGVSEEGLLAGYGEESLNMFLTANDDCIRRDGDKYFLECWRLRDTIIENNKNFDPELVKIVLDRLESSKNGMSEEELLAGYGEGKLNMFLSSIEDYIYMADDKYFLKYEAFKNIIKAVHADMEEETRKDLVDIYEKSMSASDDKEYSLIVGSDDSLNQLGALGEYDAILEIFRNDELLDRVKPGEYGVGYKNGSFYRVDDDELGFDIRDASVLSEISLILLDKANKLYDYAKNNYPEPRYDLCMTFRKSSGDEFVEYRDTFYEMPCYLEASLKYAKLALENEQDLEAKRDFYNEYIKESDRVFSFIKLVSRSGSDDLGLSHNVEDIAFGAILARRKLVKFAESENL